MKRISYWGNQNPTLARWIIAMGHLFLALWAIYVGVFLFTKNLLLPSWLANVFFGLFWTAFWLYPEKNRPNWFWTYTYTRQKTCDLILLGSAILFLLVSTNQYAHEVCSLGSLEAVFIVKNTSKEKTFSLKKQRKNFRKTAKKKLKEWRKERKNETNGIGYKVGLTIILLLGALVAAYLIAGLTCNLACNGYATLAYIVGIGGGIGLFLGIIHFLEKIYSKKAKK